MRQRGLLIAAVVLAGLSGAIYWSNHRKEDVKPAADSTTPPKIVDLRQDDITRVEIQRKSGDNTILDKKSDNNWQVSAGGKAYGADRDTVSSLLSVLSPLNSDNLVESKTAELSKYGLSDPALRVTITTKDGKKRTVAAGDDLPTGNGAYAAVQGDPRVFTISSYAKSAVDKSVQDLRDKRLLTFDGDKLIRVELLARKNDIEFGKNGQNQWQIVKPRPLRADNFQVEELIRRLKEARMDSGGDDAKKRAAAFASGQPVAVAKVTDASGTQELQVRKDKAGDYWAKSSVTDGFYKLTGDAGAGIDKSLDDFRNKKLFDFGFDEPDKIEIRDGAKSYRFEHAGQDWTSSGKKMDPIGVEGLLDKVRDLSAASFVDTGFGSPLLEVTVVSKSGKQTDHVLFSKQGDRYVAQRANEPSLYQVDAKSVEDIARAAADVKPAPQKKK